MTTRIHKRIAAVTLFLVLLVIAALPALRKYYACAMCRAMLGSAFGSGANRSSVSEEFYELQHGGQFAPSLSVLAMRFADAHLTVDWTNTPIRQVRELYTHALKIGKCPATRTELGSITDLDSWGDYIYIPWPGGRHNTPGDYPLAYDRRLSNHGGGINVVQVNRSVFWDHDAKWLLKFAQQHPQLTVPLPDDIGGISPLTTKRSVRGGQRRQ